VFVGFGKKRRGADGGDSFAERLVVRRNDAQMQRGEIAHSTRRGADVQRIARAHQDHAQILQIGRVGEFVQEGLRHRGWSPTFYVRSGEIRRGRTRAEGAQIAALKAAAP
jgi:hypothetical protein